MCLSRAHKCGFPRVLLCYLSALFQPLLHLLRWHFNIDGEVRRQELTDANVSDLIIVLHTYNAR